MNYEQKYKEALEKIKELYKEWLEDREQCFWDGVMEGKKEMEQINRAEEAYNKGYNDGIAANLADLEAEWKHGYDFAKKETWKPSEEQMKALLVAIGDEKERGSDVVKPLRSLYEDLKKLKEDKQ